MIENVPEEEDFEEDLDKNRQLRMSEVSPGIGRKLSDVSEEEIISEEGSD